MDVIRAVFVNGYLLNIASTFVAVAGLDYYQKWFFSLRPDEKMRRSSSRVLRSLGFTVAVLLAAFISTAPFFCSFLALPLTQQWGWLHDCQSFQTELILYGEANSNLPSTISFNVYMVPQGQHNPQPPQRQHVYDYVFSNTPGSDLKVLQYRSVDNTMLPQELVPSIKTMFLDMSQHKFFGCSSIFSEASLQDDITRLEANCSDAGQGTYTSDSNGYLSFSITGPLPGHSTLLRLQSKEYEFPNGAPSFSLHYVNADGSLDGIALISALTKPNSPTMLKVCSTTASPDLKDLGPLSIFLVSWRFAFQDSAELIT